MLRREKVRENKLKKFTSMNFSNFKGKGTYAPPRASVKMVLVERGFAVSSDADEWTTDPEENL